MVTLDHIREARLLIGPFVDKTPLLYSSSLSEITGAEVYIKAENLQKTGSFKVRGAFNRMAPLKGGRVAAASMGNHAQAVAFAARTLGMEALVIMPKAVPIVKEEATRGYGADVESGGKPFRMPSITPFPSRITPSSTPTTTKGSLRARARSASRSRTGSTGSMRYWSLWVGGASSRGPRWRSKRSPPASKS